MKPKIPTKMVMSDDCAINLGQVVEDGEITDAGTPYYVHQGECVELLPVITVSEVMQISKLQDTGGDAGMLGASLSALCKELSKRIVSWDWTDLMGEPMEQPYNRPDVLEALTSEELMWLMSATGAGEPADARKKDLEKSENTSSGTEDSPSMSPSE
jgi:hypothetical protein